MLVFYGEWEKNHNVQERHGEWRRMDFYGPFCSICVRKNKDEILVVPSSAWFDGAENAIGDYSVVLLMAKELFVEFGKFTLYLPQLKTYLKVNSEDSEEALLELLKTTIRLL